MDFEVDMLKFWVEQLQDILPEPSDELIAELNILNASETSSHQSR